MLENKVAVITGSARGIGKAIAEALAEWKARVVISDLKQEDCEKTAQEVQEKYQVETLAVACNVVKREEVENLANKTKEKWGRIDIWVNNAGVIRDDLLIRMKEEDWQLVIDVNLTGVFHGTQIAGKIMMKQRYGRIINISSISGLIGNVGQVNYAAAKSGVVGLTKAAARELAPRNVTVNAIAPGYIRTAMTESLPDKVKEELKKAIPLGRVGEPEDVAKVVRFLASDEASFITGVILRVDGGMAIGL